MMKLLKAERKPVNPMIGEKSDVFKFEFKRSLDLRHQFVVRTAKCRMF